MVVVVAVGCVPASSYYHASSGHEDLLLSFTPPYGSKALSHVRAVLGGQRRSCQVEEEAANVACGGQVRHETRTRG